MSGAAPAGASAAPGWLTSWHRRSALAAPSPPPAAASETATAPAAGSAPSSTNPPAALAAPAAPSRMGRATRRFRSLRNLTHPHSQVAAALPPPPPLEETVTVEQTPPPWPQATPAVPSGAATAAPNATPPVPSSTSGLSNLPSPSTLVVSITTLNLYSDLSEASGLVLCPGFRRASASASVKSAAGDPVPSHAHPEAISPTILPPVPSAEERREAQESANVQNEADEDAGNVDEKAITTKATSLAEMDHQQPPSSLATKLKESLSRLTTTTPAPVVPSPPAAASTTAPSIATTTTTTSAAPAVAPTAVPSTHLAPPQPSTWLSYLTRRSAASSGVSTTLDSISNTAGSSVDDAARESEPGDADQEHDVRAGGATMTKRKAKAPVVDALPQQPQSIAHKRASEHMQQIWLGKAQREPAPAPPAGPLPAPQPQPGAIAPANAPPPALPLPPPAPASASAAPPAPLPATPAPSPSRLGSLLRSSVSSAANLAASAVFWTLGPFDPHMPDAAKLPVEPPPPPPPPPVPTEPPPLWQTMRKVVIIGVHGWSLMGGMLGERPIVVSNKFCQSAQRALATYCKSHNVDLDRIQVCTIPLHGHGKVEQRVETYLHHQLPIFQPYITTADAIFVVAHSQGVLVSVSLMHQLIVQGWIDPSKQHVSMQLMAGLHHGPFPDLLWDLYSATKELFSYCYVDSEVHRRYIFALHYLLEHGVKVLCIGSVHDQAVPLYSSLLQSFPSCPNLLRGLYIDYSTYQHPDFLYSLLSLVVHLMNTGVHGGRSPSSEAAANVYVEALVHISGWLRGGILEKNGGAHSAVHRLTDCYNLGIEWAMAGRGVPTTVHVHSHSFAAWAPYFQESFTHTKMNRYMMVLRFRELIGLLPLTDLDAQQELARLYHLYAVWQPRTKQLKQLKDAFAPLFEVAPGNGATATTMPSAPSANTSGSAASKDDKSKGRESKDGKAPEAAPVASVAPSNGVAVDPLVSPPSPDPSLLSLLTPPRLSILPVTLPSSWQMNAENAKSTAVDLAEQVPMTGNGNGEKLPPVKRNKRLRHVKLDASAEEEAKVDAAEPKDAKPAATAAAASVVDPSQRVSMPQIQMQAKL